MLLAYRDPVRQIASGNSSACFPATSSAASIIALAFSAANNPQVPVDLRSGALGQRQSVNERDGHFLRGN